MSIPVTALVLEDQTETREHLLAALAEAFPGVVATGAADLAEARSFLNGGAPDLALVDLALPDGRGVDFLRDLSERSGGATRSVVVTIYADDAHLFDAIAAGAGGYLLKDMDRADLVRYLRRLEAGETPLSPAVARRMLDYFRKPSPAAEPEAALTPRETEVLRLIGRGLRSGEAAKVMGVTELTVAGYVKAIYRKLNICSRAEAALEAQRRGLV
ncbi:response regulator transcription factor [Caulobacter sp. RHG1]|uniref:response regulator n=1 Tax=Caulobacter sp. (strain RHG1) TaxID=2545762 RepID=UPI00155724CD|nr:response regulator transcription factor [Caulobacter sp. RHG1]NQE64573.1 Two-component transcriptional response regulator, LuxR family [Caulobacter sp. RHG1]